MIDWDIKTIIEQNYGEDFLDSITALSSPDKKGAPPLVQNDYKLYNFDKICAEVWGEGNEKSKPSSVDALHVTDRFLELIEFKSGFALRITRENYKQEEWAKCEIKGEICDGYWKYFFKAQDLEREDLKNCLKLKAVESYVFLEKELAGRPECARLKTSLPLKLRIVIDSDPVETTMETMEDLSKSTSSRSPSSLPHSKNFEAIRKALSSSLKRFRVGNNHNYYYDEITIQSNEEYQGELECVSKVQKG